MTNQTKIKNASTELRNAYIDLSYIAGHLHFVSEDLSKKLFLLSEKILSARTELEDFLEEQNDNDNQ